MSVWLSLLSAFLMYSRLPVPQVPWEERSRRWSLCFFPLIGAVIGGMLLAWYWLCGFLGWNEWLFAPVAAGIPLWVTGGIHFDGFCDVCDAKASCAPREKKLAIMSDSHIGAFALMKGSLYLLLQAGVFAQLWREDSVRLAAVFALMFVLSRSLSALTAVTLRAAKHEGTLQQFTRPAHRGVTVAVTALTAAAALAGMLLLNSLAGIGVLAGAGLTALYYIRFACKEFGGVTGDLAGYFLQLCELICMGAALLLCAVGERILL